MGIITQLRYFSKRLQSIENELSNKVLSTLVAAGEEIVVVAKQSKTYQDQTGDLSASIGYGIYSGGKQYAIGGFGSGIGAEKGRQKLEEIATKYTHSQYLLIVVAGMEYATYVERKGYVVLDAAELRANSIIKDMLNTITISDERRNH